MTLIKDVVTISAGYTDVVDLTNQYFDAAANSQLMEKYRPIKAHRDAFASLANSLNSADKRFYFLSGSYGTGKSHLCLMAANYFANPSTSPEMHAFFKNYEDSQNSVLLRPREALNETLSADLIARRREGKFLVVICRHGLNLEFEGTLLRALQDALSGTGLELNTHYNEAVRKIKEWEDRRNNHPNYNSLIAYLDANYRGMTVEGLVAGLRENRDESLKIFKESFKEITTADFTFSKDNLLDILKDILSNGDFKVAYKGIVFIYDEFGYALDDNHVRLSEMQEFAQFCANSKRDLLPVVFIGTGHKAFRNHGSVGDVVHYETIVHRVNEVGLQTQGMEDIIGAIVSPDRSKAAWKNEVESKTYVFESLVGGTNRLSLFNWLSAPVIENNIVRNIYPVHPLATYALLQLAREVGAENRSLFRFFSPKVDSGTGEWVNVDEFSYPWFVAEYNISSPSGLNLYTMDLLFDYFKDGLQPDHKKLSDRSRQSLKNYEESIRFLNNYFAKESTDHLLKKDDCDDLFYKILKIVLLFELITTERLPLAATFDNICFALNAVSSIDLESIQSRLKILVSIQVISFNKNDVYELRRSDAKDIQRMVDTLKADPKNHPTSLLDAWLKYIPLTSEEKYLEAKDYNTTFSEDKRLLKKLVYPVELEQTFRVNGVDLCFFDKCVSDREAAGIGADGYDGTAVYVFCQSDDEITESKKLFKNNNSSEVVCSVPRKSPSVVNDLRTLNALDLIKVSEDYKNFSTLEISQFNELLKLALESLNNEKLKWFNNANLQWFKDGGAPLSVNPAKPYDVANSVMELKFHSFRNKCNFPDFNKSHISISPSIKRSLNEAAEILMDLSKSIFFEKDLPANRGAVKYLQNCFVNNQLIRFLKEEGNFRFFEPESDPTKYLNVFPAYVAMLEDIENNSVQSWRNFNSFIRPYYDKYGLGQISVLLFFLLARRYFNDSLRFKQNSADYIDLNFNDTSVPFSLITLEKNNAVFKYEPVNAEQQSLYTKIYQIFASTAAAGNSFTLVQAHSAISSWWAALHQFSKIPSFYSDEFLPLHKLFSKAQPSDPYSFIKSDLMEVFGLQQNELLDQSKIDAIETKLISFKSFVEDIDESKKNVIRSGLKDIFGAETPANVDIINAIKDWYNNSLDSHQRDKTASFHNNDTKPLIKNINSRDDHALFIFDTLPSDYGLGAVNNWEVDKSHILIEKVRSGKKRIEENAARVGKLDIQFDKSVEVKGPNIRHKGGFDIIVHPENDNDIIYFTEDGSDPSDEKSQRKRLKKNEKISVSGNRTIKFVVQEPGLQYGPTQSYTVIDESDKFRIQRGNLGFKGEEQITFIFPTNSKEVELSLSSFIKEIIASNIISKKDLNALLTKIVKEYFK